MNFALHVSIWLLTNLFIGYQVVDVDSTIKALANPYARVIEVGDEALGLGNISGWAQRRLGWFWPVIKLPLIAVVAPLLWVPLPTMVQPAVILFLVAGCGYFHKITAENYRNASYQPPRRAP